MVQEFPKRRSIKLVYRWTSLALALLAGIYFVIFATDNWARIPASTFSPTLYATILGTTVLYVSGMFTAAVNWHFLLRAVDEKPRFVETLFILLISQFGKYLPGNVAHHVGRVVLARAHNMASAPVIATMSLEAGWMILTAVTIGCVAFALDGGTVFGRETNPPAAHEFAVFGVAAATIPLAAIWLIRSVRFGNLHRLLGIDGMRLPGLRPLVICFAVYAVNFLILGAILQFLASSMTAGGESHFWLLTGVFAIAWVAGFLTPGAPGGLGVREAIMVALLGSVFDPGTALALAITLRIVSTAGDGLGFVIGLLLRRYAA